MGMKSPLQKNIFLLSSLSLGGSSLEGNMVRVQELYYLGIFDLIPFHLQYFREREGCAWPSLEPYRPHMSLRLDLDVTSCRQFDPQGSILVLDGLDTYVRCTCAEGSLFVKIYHVLFVLLHLTLLQQRIRFCASFHSVMFW